MPTPNTKNNAVPRKRSRIRYRIHVIHLIVFSLVLLASCFVAVYQLTNSVSVNINVNSASIAKGMNPDGTPFDINEILSDEVLNAAIEKMGANVDADSLRSHLSISDAATSETNNQVKQSVLNGEYENTFFPSSYRVTYSVISDQVADDGIFSMIKALIRNIKLRGKEETLLAITESYEAYYEKTYLEYESLFDTDWEKIDSMDYYSRTEALRSEAMRILRFLQTKYNSNSTHTSSVSGVSYGDLSESFWHIIDVDIENHQAFIIQNGLTKSRASLIRQFSYMEEICIEESERKTEEFLILDDAVSMYDASTTKVVFIPSLDQENSFYMNRTKVGLDYLVELADQAELAAAEAKYNAERFAYLKSCFENSTSATTSKYSHADASYEQIKESILALSETTKSLLAENNRIDNEGIHVGSVSPSVSIVGAGLSFAKRTVIWFMAADVFLSVSSLFKRRKSL